MKKKSFYSLVLLLLLTYGCYRYRALKLINPTDKIDQIKINFIVFDKNSAEFREQIVVKDSSKIAILCKIIDDEKEPVWVKRTVCTLDYFSRDKIVLRLDALFYPEEIRSIGFNKGERFFNYKMTDEGFKLLDKLMDEKCEDEGIDTNYDAKNFRR